MGLPLFYRRFSAWLALLAMVAGVFTPAVTQAVVAGSERANWVQICSASGMAWVQLDDRSDGTPPSSGASGGCAWCSTHVAGGVPTTSRWWAHPLPTAHGPAAVATSAPLQRAWTPLQSRAPPAFL